MTPKEQESLFAKVRERWPRWTLRGCSGYVHGVADEAKHTRPEHHQVKMYSSKHSYAQGYVQGFIEARGPDAFTDPWLKRFETVFPMLCFEWWKECLVETANDA